MAKLNLTGRHKRFRCANNPIHISVCLARSKQVIRKVILFSLRVKKNLIKLFYFKS